MDADDWSLVKKGLLIAAGVVVGMQVLRILKLVFLDLFQTKGNYLILHHLIAIGFLAMSIQTVKSKKNRFILKNHH